MHMWRTERIQRQNLLMRNYLVSIAAVAVVTVAVITYAVNFMSAHVSVIKPVAVSSSQFHCQHFQKTRKDLSVLKTPPWSSSNINKTGKILYVWPEKMAKLRLGNRLFNYASTFGIAWHNRRLPILPNDIKAPPMYDLTEFFYLRIPVDRGDRILRVIDIKLVILVLSWAWGQRTANKTNIS